VRTVSSRAKKRTHKGSQPAAKAGLPTLPGRKTLVLGLLLAVATVAVYFPVTNHPFVNYDDTAYVVNNPHIKAGLDWETISWAFATFYQSNWHPLTWLSHALDVQMFELDPGGHHDTNLLLHVVNVLLLFWMLQKATGYVGRSAMVAGLFALHPINVESVAWVAERKNLLSMLFFLLALGAYRRYVLEPRAGRYVLVALLFVMGLMAKPQVITFPFVLLLWDYWPLRRMATASPDVSFGTLTEPFLPVRRFFWLVREKLPLFAICAASAVVTVIAQKKGGAVGSLEYFPLSIRLENAIVSYARYVGKAFWPTRLAPLYPYSLAGLPVWQVITAVLFLLAVSGVVIAGRKRRPYLLVGWLWFMGTLAPMIGLVQVGIQAMADRYAYLSFVGLFIMMCWVVADLHPKTRETGASAPLLDEVGPKQLTSFVLGGVSVAVLLVLAAQTHRQLGYWNENMALWSHTLRVTGSNFMAEDNLALSLMEQGQLEEAMKHFQAASAIYPSDPISNTQIAVYDHQHGRLQQAVERYDWMISIAPEGPGRAKLFGNRGFVYFDLRDYTHARENFEAAVAMDPGNFRGWIGLGALAQRSGDLSLAIQNYQRANAAKPSEIAYRLLAQALEQSGRKDEAQAAIERAKLLTNNLDASRIVSDGLLAH
jgi:protein O-mannosyl-transferase